MSGFTATLFGLPFDTAEVLNEIAGERASQDEKWGEQNHPDGTGMGMADWIAMEHARDVCERNAKIGQLTWRDILNEEVNEAYHETAPALLRAELVQVASVATAWIEAIDRRGQDQGSEHHEIGGEG